MTSRKIIILIVSAFIVLILFGLMVQDIIKPVKDLVSINPDIEITVSQFFQEFSDNESLANAKYIDKIVEVSGKIKEVNTLDNHLTLILSTDDPFSGISCSLANDGDIQMDSLYKNKLVIVRGECSGKLIDVILINCIIVEK
ncbi:hypothetical protein ACFLSE_00625 [Bacteroidota bacterium]